MSQERISALRDREFASNPIAGTQRSLTLISFGPIAVIGTPRSGFRAPASLTVYHVSGRRDPDHG